MKGEIIAVGTELLLGNIVNTNAQYISQRLADLGIDVYYHLVVGDNLQRASEQVRNSLRRSELIITTGGLGPTDDDLTKEAICEALGLKLVPHRDTLERIEGFFRAVERPMAECNKKQGYVPEGATVLENNNGTAPGIIIEADGKTVVLLPGPPREMKPMFEEKVFPYLKEKTSCTIKSKTLRVIGVGESSLQEMLQDLFDTQTNPTIAPYAKEGEVHLRITAKTGDDTAAEEMICAMEKKVASILGDNIYGYDDEVLEACVVRLLSEKGRTLSAAESCTGGLISSRLTDVPGASQCFLNGVVSYSNEAKMKLLKVKEETLKAHGAVSMETAREMAEGVRAVSGTDIGISVTGIAGPDGGTAEKPVGLCYIGISTEQGTEAYKYIFKGNRIKIKLNASNRALDILRRELLK